MKRAAWTALGASAVFLLLFCALAADASAQAPAVGVVSHIKVLSPKVEDVSSLEDWKKSYIKPGMTDQEKAIAIWRSVVQHQHQSSPPREFLQRGGDLLDPIKIFNVYGYSYCSVAQAEMCALARSVGLGARGWNIRGHCVMEIGYGGRWHLYDASLINYFPKPDGDVASIEEVVGQIKDWLARNPGFKGNRDKLFAFAREQEGWGFKRGPALLANCPFYSVRGWWPARTHGWYSTMQEYDGDILHSGEDGYSMGYQVNVQLRDGERLTRNWSNKGLFANKDGSGDRPAIMKMEVGKDDLVYLPDFGDLAPGRVGNGTLEYEPPLNSLKSGALTFENLAPKPLGSSPTLWLEPVDRSKPGILIIRMPTSYVYLTGELCFTSAIGADGGSIGVSLSENNGLDWKEIARIKDPGDQKVDLKKLILRRYDYRVRLELQKSSLKALKFTHDIQHSQRPLPALVQGANAIVFSAGPQEGTITLEGNSETGNKAYSLVWSDFHPVTAGAAQDRMAIAKDKGSITFPVETPGDIARVRFGAFYLGGGSPDLDVSFDGGKSWRAAALTDKSAAQNARWAVCTDVPPKTRSALVRYLGHGAPLILNFRIDVDYKEPAGGFRPVKVTYLWSEDGVDKTDVHIAKAPNETYTITCAKKPLMKSLVLELAD